MNLNSYLKANPNDGDVLLALGNIYALKSDFRASIDAYSRAKALVKDKNSCRMPVAAIYIQNKNFVAARKLLNEIITEKPEKGAHRMMGEVLVQEGDLREALSHYEKERSLHGDDIAVQENIAMLDFQLGFYVPAKTDFLKLKDLSPSHAAAYYHLAILKLRDGNIDSAKQFLKQAQALGQGNQTIYILLGDYFDQNKLSDKAIDSYRQSLSFAENKEIPLLKLADALSKAGDDSSAADTYTSLFRTDEKKYSSYLAKAGHLYIKTGLESRAEMSYALFLNKGFSDLSVNTSYASIMYKNGKYQKVISLLKPVQSQILQDGKVLTMLADSYCKIGNYSQAIPLLTKLLALNQDHRHVMKLLAIAYEKTSDTLIAISFYEKYLNFDPDEDYATDAFHLGELYEYTKYDLKSN